MAKVKRNVRINTNIHVRRLCRALERDLVIQKYDPTSSKHGGPQWVKTKTINFNDLLSLYRVAPNGKLPGWCRTSQSVVLDNDDTIRTITRIDHSTKNPKGLLAYQIYLDNNYGPFSAIELTPVEFVPWTYQDLIDKLQEFVSKGKPARFVHFYMENTDLFINKIEVGVQQTNTSCVIVKSISAIQVNTVTHRHITVNVTLKELFDNYWLIENGETCSCGVWESML